MNKIKMSGPEVKEMTGEYLEQHNGFGVKGSGSM